MSRPPVAPKGRPTIARGGNPWFLAKANGNGHEARQTNGEAAAQAGR
jgi:hypothetical protein